MRDEDITDTVFEMPELIEVRLQDARNQLKNNTFYIVQSYGVPLRKLTDEDFSIAQNSSFFIGHSLELSKFYKKYTDTKAKSGDFYENWYISPTQSVDSMYERVLSNRIFVQIQPWDRDGPVGVINAGIGNDAHHYYQFSMEDYLTNRNKGVNKNGTFVYGSRRRKIQEIFQLGRQYQVPPVRIPQPGSRAGRRRGVLGLHSRQANHSERAASGIRSVRPTTGRRTISLTTMRGTTLLRKSLKPESLRP